MFILFDKVILEDHSHFIAMNLDFQPSLESKPLANGVICLCEQLYASTDVYLLQALLLPPEVELTNLTLNHLRIDNEYFGSLYFAHEHVLLQRGQRYGTDTAENLLLNLTFNHVQSLFSEEETFQWVESNLSKEVVTGIKSLQYLYLHGSLVFTNTPPFIKHRLDLLCFASLNMFSDESRFVCLLEPAWEHLVSQFLVSILFNSSHQPLLLAFRCQRVNHTTLKV